MGDCSACVQILDQEGNALLPQVRRCETFLCRLRGLMFRRHLPPDEGLLFIERVESRLGTAIHMLFVLFPIAIVWLSSDGTVVDALIARPFHPFYAPRSPARYYLEGPPELLGRVRVGDHLTLQGLHR